MSKTIAEHSAEALIATGTRRIQGALEERLRAVDLSSWPGRAASLIVAMTVFRLFIISTTGLFDTESYYVEWSRFLDWSYYDHPPLVAWATRLVGLGSTSAFATRLGPVACAAIFGALVYRLGARLFSPRAGFVAVVTVTALPAFFFTSFSVNPESLLAPLWVLFLLLLEDMRRENEAWRPMLLGLVIGAGFLAKYTAVLEVPVALVFLVTSAETRRWLRRPSLYAGGFAALALASPVVLWNFAHGWPSLSLHLSERMPPATAARLGANALHVLLGQLVFFQFLIFPGLLVALGMTVRRARTDERYRLLAWSSGPVLLFFFVVMARACDAEPHWTMVGYVPLAVAVGGWFDERWDRPGRFWKGYARASVALSLAIATIYLIHVRTPYLMRVIPVSLYRADADPINETLGWDKISAAVNDEAKVLGADVVVSGTHNVLCGHLAQALEDQPPVYCPSPRRTEFDFMGRRDPPAEAPVIYVDTARYRDDPTRILPGRRCAAVEDIPIQRGGRTVNDFRLLACTPVETLNAIGPRSITAAPKSSALKGPTFSSRFFVSANPRSASGPMPSAAAPTIPPGTRIGRTRFGSRTRRTTRATNSSIRLVP